MEIKGKGLGIAGAVVGTIISFIAYINFKTFYNISNSDVFIEGFVEGYKSQNPAATPDEIQMGLNLVRTILYNAQYVAIFLLVIGIIALIIILLTNYENGSTMGIFIIIISVMHIISFRLLAGVLLLISGIQLRKESKLITHDYSSPIL